MSVTLTQKCVEKWGFPSSAMAPGADADVLAIAAARAGGAAEKVELASYLRDEVRVVAASGTRTPGSPNSTIGGGGDRKNKPCAEAEARTRRCSSFGPLSLGHSASVLVRTRHPQSRYPQPAIVGCRGLTDTHGRMADPFR